MLTVNHLWLLLSPALLLVSCHGAQPATGIGIKDGRLAPCPSSPNCVSSLAPDDKHWIAPLPYTGPASEAMKKLAAIVRSLPRTAIITDRGDYLHTEFTSAVFRFVDDVEFLVDDAAMVIHVRSASRVGKSDLGANRKRIELIRQRWKKEWTES